MKQILISTKQISKYRNFNLLEVGEKAYYLIHLKQKSEFKDLIPDFNLLTANLFFNIVQEIGSLTDNIENLHKIVNQEQINKLINRIFSRLEISKKLNKIFQNSTNKGFAIRPSTTILNKNLTVKNNQTLSGLFPTYLNITNSTELILALKKIIRFILSQDVFNYLQLNKLSIKDLSIAFIIQKMLIPEVSGVIYPYNPVTLNDTQITIEAVFGLGNSITNGEVIPDTYIINKGNLQILEKKINPQSWMYVPKPSKHTLEQTQKVNLSRLTQYIQKLDDTNIVKIASISKALNQHFHQSFLIEFSAIGNKIYILQLKRLSLQTQTNNKIKSSAKFTQNVPIIQGIPIYKGGEITGSVYKITKKVSKTTTLPNKEFILVANNLDKKMLINLSKNKNCLGIIFDLVPLNSDLAFLTQKLKIPSIGQTYNASKILTNNSVIKADTNTGFIYRIAVQPTKQSKPQKQNINNSPKKKTAQQNELLTYFKFLEKGIATDTKHKTFIYAPPLADIKKIANVITNYPEAIHALIYKNTYSKALIRKYEQILKKAHNNTKALIIDNFIDLNKTIADSTQLIKEVYLLINMNKLAKSVNKNNKAWYKNENFLQLIKPFIRILNNNPNIKLVYFNDKKKVSSKLISLLIELGFIGIIDFD